MTAPEQELETLKSKIQELEKKINGDKLLNEKLKKEEEAPLHMLYEWEAPDRIHTPKDKKWYTTLITIIIISIIFAILTENYLLIFAVLSIGFFIYVASSTSPKIITNAITNRGVKIGDDHYLWSDIDFFWVSERGNNFLINIELKEFKGRLFLLKGNGDINKIISEMVKHEDYREPKGMYALLSNIVEGKRKRLIDFSQKQDQP